MSSVAPVLSAELLGKPAPSLGRTMDAVREIRLFVINLITDSHVFRIYCISDKNPPFLGVFFAVVIILITVSLDLGGFL
jgi:hypothetical protein